MNEGFGESPASINQPYWDNAARLATTVVASNTLIGAATEPVAGGASDTIGRVRLNGSF